MKSPLSIDEQIAKLRTKGMRIDDDSVASLRRCLASQNYYRISGFWLTLLDPQCDNMRFRDDVSIEAIEEIMEFDSSMRATALQAIEPIEVQLRSQMAYNLSMRYGSNALRQREAFQCEQKFDRMQKSLDAAIMQSERSKVPCVLHNMGKYGDLPIWAAVEILSFGATSKAYGNLADSQIKERIAKSFGTTPYYLKSWLEYLTQIRNVCAHFSRLYNRVLPKSPAFHKANKRYANKREFPVFLVLVCLLNFSWPAKAHALIDELDAIVAKYPNVDLKPCGFPTDWKEILVQNCERSRRV